MITAGFSGIHRHGCAALSDRGRVVAVCEQERITRVRDAGCNAATGLPDEALDSLLSRRQLTRADVSRFVTAEAIDGDDERIDRVDHHLGHAATAYLTSPFSDATILICDADGRGLSVWQGHGTQIAQVDWEWHGRGPAHLYRECVAAFGLTTTAGQQRFEAIARLLPDSRDERLLSLLRTDGHSLIAEPQWQAAVQRSMAAGDGASPANAAIAASLQRRVAELTIEILSAVRKQIGNRHLCLGGSLFFHSSINTHIRQSGLFDEVFIPIDPGNAGLAVGAALLADGSKPGCVSPFLGLSYSPNEVKATLDNCKLLYNWESEEGAIQAAVTALQDGLMVGWFQGGMEWGPRALGARCILANPFAPYVLENLNRFLKHREPWRGYALSGLEDAVPDHFEGVPRATFMEFDYRPRDPQRFSHVLPRPSSAVRIQTVGDQAPPRFKRLLEAFGEATGMPFLVNTSFNGFQEPIVCDPRDAVRVYYGTGLDVLVADQFVLRK